MSKAVALIGVAALGACAPRQNIRAVPTQPTVSVVHIKNVPFFADNTDQCGPSSLASVLSYWGHNVEPGELKRDIYLPKLKGTLPLDLLPAAKSRGLTGDVTNGNFDDIKLAITKGCPVIAYLDFGTVSHPVGHFVVITGFNDERKELTIHSGLKQDKFASYTRFDRGWKDTNRWMLVVRPLEPGEILPTANNQTRLPLSTMPARFHDTLTADEHVQLGSIYEKQNGVDAAEKEYLKALKLNKVHLAAMLGLGNIAYGKSDYKTAEKYYSRILLKDPSNPSAQNNLAMVYLAEKKFAQAEKLALQAATSKDHAAIANDTLAQIREAQSQTPH